MIAPLLALSVCLAMIVPLLALSTDASSCSSIDSVDTVRLLVLKQGWIVVVGGGWGVLFLLLLL